MHDNFRSNRSDVIRQAFASHRLADVEGGASPGHRVDDEVARLGEIVERMGDDPGRDRAGMGDAEGPVVLEGPDVVGGRAEAGAEAIAASEVFVGGVNGLGPGVELGDSAHGSGVSRPGDQPDLAGLAVDVLPAHSRSRRRWWNRCDPSDRPEFRQSDEPGGWPPWRRLAETPTSGLVGEERFEGIGLAHELAERLGPVAVVGEDQATSVLLARRRADLAGDVGEPQEAGAGEPTVTGEDFPRIAGRDEDEGDEDAKGPDALDQPVSLCLWFAIN